VALAEAGLCRFEGRAFAAPPGGHRGQHQVFAQQGLGQPGQKAQQPLRLQEGRAGQVGHQQVAAAQRLQQPGHAQRGVGAQLQRVAPCVVHALEQGMHRLQPAQGAQVQPFVAHRQVAALHQGDAQVARQVGVLEIGFVVGAGRQQGDVRVGAGRGHGPQAIDPGPVAGGQALDLQGLERAREQPGDGQPVLQHIAQAGGGLGALRDHGPFPVGAAGQVEGGNVQVVAARGRHAVHAAQVARVALDQRGGQQALPQGGLGAIGIGQHAIQQAHALQHAGLDPAPGRCFQDQREQV
jgi:hypothetical protein